MASKLQIVTAIFNDEVNKATESQQNWTSFLRTAANNFKYSFPDQILIYAQKPEATACAEISFWNEKFHRWVNRGATGIALLNFTGNNPKLRYVFDVSDTNSRQNIDIPSWQVEERYEAEIIEALENAFGEIGRGSLASIIDDTAQNMVDDNILDYLYNLDEAKYGSFLEDFDEDNLRSVLRNTLVSSIGYMMMTRCGINADDFYDPEDFKDLYNFNTHETIIALGSATSEIAEMGLREIETTVKALQKEEKNKNRTFVSSYDFGYDEGAKKKTDTERRNEDVTDNLQTGRRLQNPEHHSVSGGEERYTWQVRIDEEELPDESPESEVQHTSDDGRTDETPASDGTGSTADVGTDNRTDDEIRRSDGNPERDRPDEVGADDEQHQSISRGNGTEGTDLQLSNHDFDARWNGIEYFHQDKEKNELIKTFLAPHTEEIAMFYESHPDKKERSDFIMSFFNSAPYEITLSNGVKAGFEAYSDAIRLWRNDGTELREAWQKWFQIERSVFGLMLMEEWTEPQALLLPGVEKQMELIGTKVNNEAPLFLPQSAVDYVLCGGSDFSEGKMRIYRQFTESLSQEENIKFLKNEYGTGGHSNALPGSGFWEGHDSKGIEISDHYSVPPRRVLLKWNYVESRLSALIKSDRYLNPKEKEMYPQWLENRLIIEEEWRIENEVRQLLRNAPEEKEQPKEYRYEYNLGDTVYIGADEYTIISLEDPVILSNIQYPLFTEEFSKAVFEKRVRENPANNHLRVEVDVERPAVNDEAETEIDESNKPDFLLKYEQVQKENPDSVVLLHTGGFYNAFGKDAEILSMHTHYTAPRKNLYGNVFTPCCQILDFNLSYCVKELNAQNIDIVVMSLDKGVIDRYSATPILDEVEIPEITESNRNNFLDEYNEIKADNPDSVVLYQVGDFFEAFNDDAKTLASSLQLVLTSRAVNDNERVPMVGFPVHRLEAYLENIRKESRVVISAIPDGETARKTFRMPQIGENSELEPIEKAKKLIDKFCIKEYGKGADFSDMKNIEIAYTTFTDAEIPVQVSVNLVDYRIDRFIDNNHYDSRSYNNLESLIEYELYGLDFDDLVYIPDEVFESKTYTNTGLDSEVTGKEVTNERTLAERLVAFYRDFDFYGFRDTLEIGESEKDAASKLAADLQNPKSIDSVIAQLKSIVEESETDDKNIAEQLIKELEREKEKLSVIPDSELIGKEVIIDGTKFVIEKIDPVFGDVSMRDTSVLYPINRVEKIGRIRELIKQQTAPTYSTEKVAEIPTEESGLPFDVVLQTIRTEEPALTPTVWEEKKEKVTTLHPTVPDSEKHNFRITDDNLGVGGAKEKFRNNMAAINLLHELEFENRLATPEEQEILSKYVGFGGLSDAFDETKENWANEYKELIVTLSPEEYAAARESTLTAFYTPPVVIRAMYEALGNMGFENGNILEPSCGTGNFIGMLPDKMSESKFYGVELDSLTGRIAQQLYQKSGITVQGYEEAALPDSFFDVAVGNVPFGQFKVIDKKYDKHNWLIHDYFFGKTLDKVRPGGVIAFVTSSGTMDKKNPAVRKYIAQRAELLGAIRLPNNTFKANAGTEVTSDILFLQKRDTLVNDEPDWVLLDRDENGNEYNKYFVDHPEMVLGDMVMESSQFGQSLTCRPYEGRELSDLLSEAIQNIHAEIKDFELSDVGESEDLSVPADPNVKNFSFTVVEDKIYYRHDSRMTPVDVSATAESRIKGMIEIRDCVRELIRLQTDDYPDSAILSAQERLNEIYDKFTKKYGLLNARANRLVFSDDSSYCLLCSLEVIGENGELKRKADMFTKRTIKPHIAVTSVETASEALAVSIGEKACVDMDYMCKLTGKTEQMLFEELKGVIFLNPEHTSEDSRVPRYLTADEYLSGNVRKKLELAKRTAEIYPDDYSANVEMLEKVQPEDLTASEISVRLGATWLPVDVVEQFMFELLQTPRYAQWNIKVHYSPISAEWNIENKNYDRMNVIANTTYGTSRINAYKIIEETLNLKDVRIFDYVEDENGNRKPVLNKKETAIAQGKQEMIKQAFQDWIWQDPHRREKLVRIYNDKFNCMRPREYDGSHINFSGMNPEITLRPHQVNAVARIMYGGNSLLAHVVGAGKTFTMVAAAQESKRLGLCNKSLIVVPNHLTEQWAAEYLQLYPSANILVATKKDFETKNRKKFCARIATGDYDAIIIGHSQFEKIPLSLERQKRMLEEQIDEITVGIGQIKFNKGEKFSVKQLEKTKKSLQAKLQKLNDQTRKDDVVTFEELGVDRLFVDEAHNFKNLYLYTKMRNVGGIAQTEAQKSSDLYMKCRYLDEITGSKGVIFATGTPVSNSMVELYTMQRYLQYETLVDRNLQHFDAWASTFGETVTAIELAPEGTGYRAKTRFAKFYNLPELMMMFKQMADIQTADMLNLPVPKANYHNVAVKPTEQQKEIVASLAERAEKVRNKMVSSNIDNMLLITNDGRKTALDQRLVNELLPDDPSSKVSVCADNVFDMWNKTTPQKSTQLVFCDLSTPHNDGKFNVYDDIRKKLIAKGIPEAEIAFIHDADTEAKKKELFGKVRTGKVRVLIGSTAKMGAGTNVQQKLIAIHHTDCPWRPADLQQREGRIVRQGNENPEVDIFSYVTEETFDAYLYQLVENKQKFIGQIMTSKSPVRSAEDVDEQALSYAEIKALATGNPYIKEKMDLDVAVSKLKLMKQSHLSQRYALEDKVVMFYPKEILRLENRIKGYEEDIKMVAEKSVPNSDGFCPMVLEGITHTEKKAAGSAILEICQSMKSPEPKAIGSYRGFELELSFDTFQKQFILTLVGSLRHSTPLGSDVHGNITRLDNLIGDFEKKKTACIEQLEDTKTQLANAKEQIEQPFPQEDELNAKMERLGELNALLDMNHNDNEIDDGDIEETERPDKEKNRETAR